MNKCMITSGALSLLLGSALVAGQGGDVGNRRPGEVGNRQPPPNSSLQQGKAEEPKDPFSSAPADKVSFQKVKGGVLVVSNVTGNRYTYLLAGNDIKQLQQENKANPHARIWTVDGIVMQSVPLPLGREGGLGYIEVLLNDGLKYENDHWAKQGYKEVESARKWLHFGDGESALYWELRAPEKAQSGPKKMLFANAVNGRHMILFAATILPDVDEANARKLLTDAALSLKHYEKHAASILYRGDAKATLLNDDLATRQDRKMPGAIILNPEQLILVVRMSLELDPPPAGCITFVHDGKSGHMVTLQDYDRTKKRFTYTDSLGNRSFLQEGNNRAGVKAEQIKGSRFSVTEAELQSVLVGVMSIPVSGLRAYFAATKLEDGVRIYQAVATAFPGDRELTEAFLLRAAQILAEGKEAERAVNVFGVCLMLHKKSARALAGIADVYATSGQTKPAVNFYADAIKALPEDPAVDAKQREQLAAAWSTAKKAIAAKNSPK
jgi:hypothetical protein